MNSIAATLTSPDLAGMFASMASPVQSASEAPAFLNLINAIFGKPEAAPQSQTQSNSPDSATAPITAQMDPAVLANALIRSMSSAPNSAVVGTKTVAVAQVDPARPVSKAPGSARTVGSPLEPAARIQSLRAANSAAIGTKSKRTAVSQPYPAGQQPIEARPKDVKAATAVVSMLGQMSLNVALVIPAPISAVPALVLCDGSSQTADVQIPAGVPHEPMPTSTQSTITPATNADPVMRNIAAQPALPSAVARVKTDGIGLVAASPNAAPALPATVNASGGDRKRNALQARANPNQLLRTEEQVPPAGSPVVDAPVDGAESADGFDGPPVALMIERPVAPIAPAKSEDVLNASLAAPCGRGSMAEQVNPRNILPPSVAPEAAVPCTIEPQPERVAVAFQARITPIPRDERAGEQQPERREAAPTKIEWVSDAPRATEWPVAAKSDRLEMPFQQVAQSLRSADVASAPAAMVRVTNVHAIALRIAQPEAPAVELHVTERAGEIRVAVKTQDAGLQTSLRQDLGSLSNSLERAGYRAQTFVPIVDAARRLQGEFRMERESQQGFSNRGGRDAEQQQSRQQRDSKKWIEELENLA